MQDSSDPHDTVFTRPRIKHAREQMRTRTSLNSSIPKKAEAKMLNYYKNYIEDFYKEGLEEVLGPPFPERKSGKPVPVDYFP